MKKNRTTPIKRAFLCGINYTGTENQLNGCVNDIANINNFLVQKCNFSPANILILTDNPRFGKGLPTRMSIANTFYEFIRDCIPGDILVFYYSGHGANLRDRSGDESDGVDGVIVPLDYDKLGVITDDWIFKNVVTPLPVGVTLWAFTDCCHSGTMLDLQFNLQDNCVYKGNDDLKDEYIPDEWSNQYSIIREKSKETKADVYLFSGCLDPQTALDITIRNKAQGAFTSCLLEMFNKMCVNTEAGYIIFKPNNLKIIDMLKELNCRLTIGGFEQRCQLSMGKFLDVNKLFLL